MTGEDFFKIALQAVKDSWGKSQDETDLGSPYFRLDVIAKGVIGALEQAGAFFSNGTPDVEQLRKNLAEASLRADLAEKELGHMTSGPGGRDEWKKHALRATNRADELQREVEILRDQVNELDTNVGADSTQLVRMKQQCDAHIEAVENLTKLNDELRVDLAALELWHGRTHNALTEIIRRAEDMVRTSPPL